MPQFNPNRNAQSREWCFTWNNPTEDDERRLIQYAHDFGIHGIDYIVFGREIASTGTRHLQGYVVFNHRKRFGAVRRWFCDLGGAGVHIERRGANSSPQQAADYCKKDGDYAEYGECPATPQPGRRTDWERFHDYVTGLDSRPDSNELFAAFPSLFGRYEERLWQIIDDHLPPIELETAPFRDWQEELADRLAVEPNDREINFVYDPVGGTGKSFFIRRYLTLFPKKTQRLSVGKRDDLAHAIDPNKTVFLFDIPRTQMEFLQYSVLEQLKDRLIFSPKYNSQNKVMRNKVHVVVFCNEEPDYNKMTNDRYHLIRPQHADRVNFNM